MFAQPINIQSSVNVTGLISGSEIILQNNGGDDLSVTDNGSYNFAAALDDESNYNVTILSQPSSYIQEYFVNLGLDNCKALM